MKKTISPKLISLCISITTILFVCTFFAFAWTEPGAAPPGGNVYAPVNIGSTSQTKTGDLTLKNLYLNATASEGNIYRINQLIGYNDIFIKGNSGETAPVYLAGNKIYAYTNSQTRLFIDTNGNIGIGTTSPGYKLTINGSIGTPNINHPYLVLDSSSSGNNNNEQSAQISLGESGRGSASLHLSYIGNGYGYIGMGSLGSDNIPDHWGLRFYYQNNDVYAHNNINANDVYIRAAGKWASTLGSGSDSLWTDVGSYIRPNNYTSIVITDSGRIGIKDTSPSYELDVAGTIRATADIRTNDDIIFYGELMPDGATCSSGQILKKSGSNNWDCVDMPSGGGSGDITAVNAGSGLGGGGISGDVTLYVNTSRSYGTEIYSDTISLRRDCSSGQVLKWSGSSWYCATDNTGGGGSMPEAGNGLYYSGSTLHIGAGTGISVGSNDVRIRYPSYSCPSGYSLRSINLSNGSKTCEKDDTGSGGSLVCTVKTITLNGIGTKYLYCDSGYQRMSCSIAIKNGYAVPYSSNGCKIHNDQLTFGVKGYAVCCKIQ